MSSRRMTSEQEAVVEARLIERAGLRALVIRQRIQIDRMTAACKYALSEARRHSDGSLLERVLREALEKVLAPDHGFNSERSKQSENGGRP